MRYKFGPQIVGTYPRPEVPGELPDVDVTASVKAYRAGDPGEIDLDIAFQFPPYDPSTSNPIVEVHALSFGPGHGIPTDPALAIASSVPKASSVPPASLSAGGEHVVTIAGSMVGLLTIVTVLGYADAPTPTPTPTPTPAPAPTS